MLLIVLGGPLLAGCGDDSNTPVRATLAELVRGQEDYEGREVETTGIVRRFGEAEGSTRIHYVIEDRHANRVAIRPDNLARPHAGRQVLVVGSFDFSETDGRSIEIDRIERR